MQTTVIPIDLSRPTTENFAAYSQWIAQPEVQVGVLVNNAGVSHSMPVSFAETSLEQMDNVLQVVSTVVPVSPESLNLGNRCSHSLFFVRTSTPPSS